MLKKILIALVAVLAVLAIVIAMQPSSYRVVRTATISSPPSEVFTLINDFHNWESWSPWAKLDPAMKTTYEGSSSGTGSIYTWNGNSDVGEGRMTILESRPNDAIRVKLEFIRPFPDSSNVEFNLKPAGSGTHVDWVMFGENNFMSKAFCLFMGGMDKMVGPDFEKGLAQMKSLAEAAARR